MITKGRQSRREREEKHSRIWCRQFTVVDSVVVKELDVPANQEKKGCRDTSFAFGAGLGKIVRSALRPGPH